MAKRGLDYYGVLGLTKGASDTEIKEAYRHLSLQYNPVRNKDLELEDLFCLVGEAYEVLANPLLKSIYDQYGEVGLKKGVITPVGWHPPWFYHREPLRTFKHFFGTANPYADLMYCMRNQVSLFNPDRIEDVNVKEEPIERDLELSLEESYNGTMKKIKVQRKVYDNDKITTKLQEKILCIPIKPGTPSGTKIIFQGVGNEGPSIIPGDLVIITKDMPHERFKRIGVDLHMEVTLNLIQSLEKLMIELNTLDDRVIRFAITDVIVNGYVKVVRGEGMPYVDDTSKKGDLIIKFDVQAPTYMSETRNRKLLETLLEQDELMDKNSPENLYKLWIAARQKNLHIKTPAVTPQHTEESLHKEEGRQDCVGVSINKGRIYKL